MTEKKLRKSHGTIGVILALFLFVQFGSGSLIAFDEFLGHGRHVHAESDQYATNAKGNGNGAEDRDENLLEIIHHHGGRLIQALRVLLGLGALYMVISGTRIYALAHKRNQQLSDKHGAKP